MATAPKMSISGELIAARRHRAQVRAEQPAAPPCGSAYLPRSMLKAFTMRLPVIVSCRMFWMSASLSCPRAGGVAHPAPNLAAPNK